MFSDVAHSDSHTGRKRPRYTKNKNSYTKHTKMSVAAHWAAAAAYIFGLAGAGTGCAFGTWGGVADSRTERSA